MKNNLHIIILSVLFSIILWGSISLSDDYYASYEIPIKLVNFPKGYTTGTPIPQKVSIKLKGHGWKLISVAIRGKSDYLVSVEGDSGKRYVNLYNFLTENQWLTSDMQVIDITPDTLSFYVERISHKKIAVISNLNLKFNPGYGLATPLKISPDSTIVYGPVSKLKNLYTVPTQNITIDNLDDKKVARVPIKSIQGMDYESALVNVSLNVQKIVDKNIDELPVEILDIPRDRNVVLLPNKVSVGIRGGIDILGKLARDDFKAYINYREVVLDTVGSVIPQIKLPINTTLIYIKPERLRYIIKKFN